MGQGIWDTRQRRRGWEAPYSCSSQMTNQYKSTNSQFVPISRCYPSLLPFLCLFGKDRSYLLGRGLHSGPRRVDLEPQSPGCNNILLHRVLSGQPGPWHCSVDQVGRGCTPPTRDSTGQGFFSAELGKVASWTTTPRTIKLGDTRSCCLQSSVCLFLNPDFPSSCKRKVCLCSALRSLTWNIGSSLW